MSTNFNTHLQALFKESNRIVITASKPFNPKNKKSIMALADIRDPGDMKLAKSVLGVDLDSCPSWMSPVDIYLNFMLEKSLINSVGIVLGSWLRCPGWSGDYALVDYHAFHRWLGSPSGNLYPASNVISTGQSPWSAAPAQSCSRKSF